MSFPNVNIKKIASVVQGEIEGDDQIIISGVNPIEQAGKGDLTFITKEKFVDYLVDTSAAAVLIHSNISIPEKVRPTLIRVSNPYFAFLQIIKQMMPGPSNSLEPGIHKTAQIGRDVQLGKNAIIGPLTILEAGCKIGNNVQISAGSYIGQNSQIGENTFLYPHVHIANDVNIGKNVIIQSGTVIGSDGFGYVKNDDRYHKIPHLGNVVIDDDVEIGANCCIDRGTFGKTHIHTGVKLDNLIHVAHNVEIGEHTVIAAQTGISGSTKIGDGVTVAGQVGFVGHISIGDKTIFGAQAGVTKSIPAGMTVSGYPARDHVKSRKEEAATRRLPKLLKRVKALENLITNGRLGKN